ncbi:DUF6507 family protein [Streptomyces morookaense]|uniref:Uncharacterized protein n=1 Tax=Streptomyces morookaense TaxID=1970 RepID=A0A7Y7BB13_STRMO|nr:DUF6507 family protein [Streptomyces morookaense]NVK81836.1 hypothetical protein [Streptomyces morookaense]GHF19096.1 hypothetical protein GCM10010359_20990 [Streptomyces morookaense]
MARWDVEPGTVRTVVGNTAKAAGELQGPAESYAKHVQSAATNAGSLVGPCEAPGGLVGPALVAWANGMTPDLEFMAERTQRTLEGALLAVGAYEDGDQEMAERLERAAIEGRDPKDILGEAETPGGRKRS